MALKEAVLQYIEILQEEKARSAALSRKRAEKKELREHISQLMRQENLDDAVIPDTATISRRPKRRLSALKRSAVEAWATELIGDQDRTAEEVGRLYDGRQVTTVEELTVSAA